MGLMEKIKSAWKNESTTPVLDMELATDDTRIHKQMKSVQYFPDRLLTRKKIGIYNEMMLDPEISSAVGTLKIIRLSTGWEVNPASDSPQDKNIADEVKSNLDNIQGSFEDDISEIMGACELGLSLNELIWGKWENGKYAGRIRLQAIKSKNPEKYNIVSDDFDNLMPNSVIPLSDYGEGFKELPTEKFIIYSFGKKYENVWGTSRLRSLYDLWFIKKFMEKQWAIFMEKFGMPLPIIKHPKGITPEVRASLLGILKQLRMESGILVPEGLELTIQDSKATGSSIFTEAMSFINEQIRKTILGQTLTSSQGDKGSYALGQVHFDILTFYIDQLGRDVAEKAVNQQLVKRLVDYNYSDVSEYPKFAFKSLVKDDVPVIIEKYYLGVSNGSIKPIPEDEVKLREWLRMPARKTEEAPSEAVNAQPEVKPEVKPEVPPTPAKIEASERRIVYSKFAEKIFTGVRRRTFTEYEEATDFNELRDIVESNSYDATVSIAETLREGVDGILKDIVNKKIIEDKNFPAIDKLHLKYLGDIKDGFKGALSKVYEQGMRSARREIIEKKKISKFEAAFDFRNMTPKEALEYFANKSYFMAQVERDFVFKTLKPIIYNAIKSGATIKDFIDETNKALEPYFVTGALDEAAFNSYRLETILRTNLNEAMNEGRKAFFESPETKGYVQAYQYSAILDDRVRENHAALDGLIFSITSPAIARISPPNGYNCRCLLIPVTEDEKWEEDKLPGGWGADAGFDKPGY